MKRTFILLIYCFTLLNLAFTQPPTWQWAKTAGGAQNEYTTSVVTDKDGNVYVGGYFQSPFITIGNTTLTKPDTLSFNFFLAKYDAAGNSIWVRSSTSNDTAGIYGLATDKSGNVYAVGSFLSDSLSFGNIVLVNSSINSAGTNTDVFIVKYDPAGNVLWAKKEGGKSSEQAYGITVDKNYNVYITGYFGGIYCQFDTIHLTNNGLDNIFLARLDSAGNLIWAKHFGGEYSDAAFAICNDDAGNIYIAGGHQSQSIILGHDTLTGTQNDRQILIAKFDAHGNALWGAVSTSFPGDFANFFNNASGITADAAGNVYVTGKFASQQLIFDTTHLYFPGIFWVKYNTDGKMQWLKGGDAGGGGTAICSDAAGNVYLAGGYLAYITLDTFYLTDQRKDLFIVKIDTQTGRPVWIRTDGGNNSENIAAITVDMTGNIYATGYYKHYDTTFTFTPASFDNIVLPNAQKEDFFLGKLENAPAGLLMTASEIGSAILYPNPTSGNFYIKCPVGYNHLYIYDAIGQAISSATLNENGQNINIPAPGIYFYRATSHDKPVLSGSIVVR